MKSMVLQISITQKTIPTVFNSTLTAASNGCFNKVKIDEVILTIEKQIL